MLLAFPLRDKVRVSSSCAFCDASFVPRRSSVRFCSEKCRNASYAQEWELIRARRRSGEELEPQEVSPPGGRVLSPGKGLRAKLDQVEQERDAALLELDQVRELLALSAEGCALRVSPMECKRLARKAAPPWWFSLPPEEQEMTLYQASRWMKQGQQPPQVAWELARLKRVFEGGPRLMGESGTVDP